MGAKKWSTWGQADLFYIEKIKSGFSVNSNKLKEEKVDVAQRKVRLRKWRE
jgi:hypothetical protein